MNKIFKKLLIQRISFLQQQNLRTIFTIATTAKIEEKPYLTPLRTTNDFIFTGCIIFNKNDLIKILKFIDGKVDLILIDHEKKIPIKITKKENTKNIYTEGTIGLIDTNNFYKTAVKLVHKSEVTGFKPNDLTVDAIWSYLNYKNIFLNSCKISIIGSGNIGSKIALKTVECGANIHLYGRNHYKTSSISSALNMIKAKSTLSNINFCDDILKATFMSNVLICATNGIPIITDEIIKSIKTDAIIIEVGKNNLTKKAIKLAIKKNIEIYRLDVSATLTSYISTILATKDILQNKYGKNTINNINFVSGGYFGKKGDIVVDNCHKPTILYGEADGIGSLVQNIKKKKRKKIIEILKGEF